MPAKSRKSSASKTTRTSGKTDRPFDADLLAEAGRLAEEYQVILTHEEGHWYGRGLELPLVFGDGKTPNTCVANVREAMTGAIAHLLEQGKRPPRPAREAKRTEQVNVRLTAEERARAEAAAKQQGFKGLSDYFRSAALESETVQGD